MLVQRRTRGLRLITQHDHALAAGTLAAAWRGSGGGGALPPALVVATALHDVMWREEDARPSLDPDTGAVMDFTRAAAEHKRAFAEPVLRTLEGLEPEVGRLVRLHHETLGTAADAPRALAWLRLFDRLSLYVCLTPHGSLEEARPSWLGPRTNAPDGTPLSLQWEDERHLRVDPWPFAGSALVLDVPFRELQAGPWESPDELEEAWRDAEVRRASVTILPAG